jgi:uncharacterized membrane protein
MLVGAAGAIALGGCQAEQAAPGAAAPADETSAPAAAPAPDNAAEPAAKASITAAPKAAPSPAAAPFSPGGYALNGTEPFWGGTLTGTSLVYTTPDNQTGETVPVTVVLAADRETYTGSLDGQPVIVTLTKAACSDGMSDRNYPYTAVVQVKGETRQGCAAPR